MKTIAETVGVARSNLVVQAAAAHASGSAGADDPSRKTSCWPRSRPPLPDQPTYGYRRIHALLSATAPRTKVQCPVNVKRVYRVMKAHGLLLERHTGKGEERRHDGRVAVDHPDTRWCSDGFEIGYDNGERVRIAFTLDCCDREAISWVATTGGINGGDIRDLMLESVERRFGLVDRLPVPIEWLSDNGSPYTAHKTRAFAGEIGLVPRTTPIESPQSNGMAEAFVKTIKRDYARVAVRPDAASVLRQLDFWFEHYNNIHPHQALGYRSPREFREQLVKKTRPRTRSALGVGRMKHNVCGCGRVKVAAAGGGGAQRQP